MIPAAQPLPQTAADIPQRSYAPMKDPSTGLDTTNAQCAHCRQGLLERDIVKQPQCGHLFHAHCIDSYLRTEICCPVCKAQLLFPTVAAGSVYPSAQLPPRAVPVATTFAPVDGTNARDYAACRGCGQMFYRDPRRVRPETSGWYRCERCAETNIVDFMRGSCVLQLHSHWLKLCVPKWSTSNVVMVTRKRTKHGARKEPTPKLKAFLKEGDWLDVMDGDGVWNVARVLSVPSPGEVEITYDGWPAEYDEVVRVDSDRVAPYHTFTWAVKCWVKYLNWPLWPSLVTIRTPGTPKGIKNLASENRLHIDFLDNPNFAKRDRCWQMKRQVRAFENDYDKKRTGSTGDQFEQALGWVLQADAPTKLPKFAGGTLPENYEHKTTESIKEVRRQMGDELWFQNFTNNRMRHQLTHVYNTNGDEEEYSSDESSPATLKIEKRTLNLSAVKKEPQALPKEKKRPPPVKIEQESVPDVEVPYELEPLNSSDDSASKEDQKTTRTKRRRLRTKPSEARVTENRRSSSPHASTFISTHAPVDRKKGHRKGQIKMAARRSFPPVGGILNLTADDIPIPNYSPDEDHDREYGAVNSEKSALRTDTAPTHFTNHRTEKLSNSEAELDSDDNSTSSRGSVERDIVLTKKKLEALEQEKQRATKDRSARRGGIRLSDPSPMSADSQGRAQPISPCADETRRAKRASSTLSKHPREVDEVLVPEPLSKMNEPDKGMTIGASDDVVLDSEKLGCSLLSENRAHSSDRNESKGAFNEEMEINTVETTCVEQTGSQSGETADIMVEPPSQQKVSSEDEESQEQRRPFCVMQAQKEDVQLADTKEKVKISMKTIISVPRKFDEKKAVGLQVPDCLLTNPTLRMAPPPRLCLPSSGGALAFPSTGIFSSNKGFSMESWFQRKLMRNFMNGEA